MKKIICNLYQPPRLTVVKFIVEAGFQNSPTVQTLAPPPLESMTNANNSGDLFWDGSDNANGGSTESFSNRPWQQ